MGQSIARSRLCQPCRKALRLCSHIQESLHGRACDLRPVFLTCAHDKSPTQQNCHNRRLGGRCTTPHSKDHFGVSRKRHRRGDRIKAKSRGAWGSTTGPSCDLVARASRKNPNFGDRPRERSVRRTRYCRFSVIHRNLTRPLNDRSNSSGSCRKTLSI